MNLAELLHKAQRGIFSNDREQRMADLPIWYLCGKKNVKEAMKHFKDINKFSL